MGSRGKGHTYNLTDSCCCTEKKQYNVVKQLSSNKNKFEKKRNRQKTSPENMKNSN